MKNSYSLLVALALGTVLCVVAARRSAAQPGVLSSGPTVETYCRAWGTADRADRDRLLSQVWAPDGTYTDPESTVVKGRKALSDEIANFLRAYPGGHFRCSSPQVHHRAMRIAWVLLRPDGTQWAQGMDFGELAADGRIRRIVGFFGPLPTVTP